MEQSFAPRIHEYLDQTRNSLDRIPVADIERVIEEVLRANERGSQVFILGNGGSASASSHFACDLGKGTIIPGRPRFRVIALSDNIALITAWANDFDYTDIFAEQLTNLIRPQDLVIGISGSGKSPNVVKALRCAREMGGITVAFTGFDGGLVKDIVDIPVIAPGNFMGQIEDMHLILVHMVCTLVRERLVEHVPQTA